MIKRLLSFALVVLLACTPVQAQFFPFPGPGKAATGGGGSASFTPVYGDAQYINSTSSTYTSPSQTWTSGTAIVFVITADAVRTDLTVTIKGTTATQVGTYGGTGQKGSLWRAAVTAGSGTVVVTTSSGNFIHVDTSGGVVTTTTPAPSASQIVDMAIVGEPQGTVTATVPSSGVGVAFAGGSFVTAASLPMTWTGVTNSTTLAAAVTGGNNSGIGGGSTTTSGSTSPTVSTADGAFNFTGSNAVMAIVTWSP